MRYQQRGFPLVYHKDQGLVCVSCKGLLQRHVLFSSIVDKAGDALMWSRPGPPQPSSYSDICGVERLFAGITCERSYLLRSRVSRLHLDLMLCLVITLNLCLDSGYCKHERKTVWLPRNKHTNITKSMCTYLYNLSVLAQTTTQIMISRWKESDTCKHALWINYRP